MNLPIEKDGNTKGATGLKSECLSFTQVLSQSIANIGPSVGPALGIPVTFAMAGNATWLTYLVATITMLLVGYNINQFTKRSASPGSIYTFISDGIGPTPGVIAGWGLILAYVMTGSACLAGFSIYASMLLSVLGIKLPIAIVALAGGLSAGYLAFRDVKLSAKLMLLFEVISTMLVVALFAVVLFHKGSNVDFNQLNLKDVSFDGLRTGLVLAFFTFTGFESAAALGEEAKNPLKNIPRTLTISVLLVGSLFIFFSYTEIAGFIGNATKLSEAEAPLSILSNINGVPFMGLLLNIGATISFWSCMVAVITASARIIFYMSHHKILPSAFNDVHSEHGTPHKAVIISAFVLIIVPVTMMIFKNNVFDIFGWLGTIATYGFLLCYTLCVIATPIFLNRNNLLKTKHIIISVITIIALLIPIVGSVYPLASYPINILQIVFLIWILAGGIYFTLKCKRDPNIVKDLKEDLNSINKRFQI